MYQHFVFVTSIIILNRRSDVSSFGLWKNLSFKVYVKKTTNVKELKDELIILNKNFFQHYHLEIEKKKTEMQTLKQEDFIQFKDGVHVAGTHGGFISKTNKYQKIDAFTNRLIPREKGHADTRYLEESCAIMSAVRDKGCDFAAFGINDSKSFQIPHKSRKCEDVKADSEGI